MAVNLGGSKSKSTQTGTNTSTQTSTTSLNPWSQNQWEQGAQGIFSTIDNYNQNSPYQGYTGPAVAGLSGTEQNLRGVFAGANDNYSNLMTGAIGQTQQAANAGPTTMNAAQVGGVFGYTPQQAEAVGASAGQIGRMDQIGSRMGEIDTYMNPELARVVDTTLAGYDEDAARQRARMQAQAAGSGAFGGSRYGVAQGVFDADTSRGRAATEAGLRSNAFNNATNLLGTDVNAVNQGKIAQAGYDTQANLATAQNQQATNLANTGAANEAARYGADAKNQGVFANAGFEQQANQTNAQLQEQALNRQMQGGAQVGQLASAIQGNAMQAAQFMRQLGLDERQIEQAQLDASRADQDREAADRLQRLMIELQAKQGVFANTPMLVDQTQTGTGNFTQNGSTSGSEWGFNASWNPTTGFGPMPKTN